MTITRAGARRLRLSMLVLLALAYAVFMILAAFAPASLAGPLVDGGATSFWFVYGICLIWLVVLTTGLYVLAVNAAEDAGR